jgi:hypothetical protein
LHFLPFFIMLNLLLLISAANVVETRNMDEAKIIIGVVAAAGDDDMCAASGDEGCASSRGRTDDSIDEKASNDENSWTYNFGASTITLSRIKEMTEKGYFADGEARAPRAETVPELEEGEAIVYEDFLVAGLRMPPHAALVDILLKFQMQLHQLDTECDCTTLEVFLGCR